MPADRELVPPSVSMRFAVAACLVLSGCELVFPLEGAITGTLKQRTITNGPDGLPAVIDVGIETAGEVTFADGTTAMVVVDPQGDFTLDPDGARPYRLAFPIGVEMFELQSAASELALARTELGRRTTTETPIGTELTFTDYVPAGGVPSVASTGVWATASFDAATKATRWDKAGPLTSAKLGLLDAAQGDRLYLVESAASFDMQGAGYAAMTHALEVPITMPGGPQPVGGALVPLVRERCTTILSRAAEESARMQAVYSGFTEKFARWSIDAVPRPDVDNLGNHSVASQFDLAIGPLVNRTVSATYSNPFPGTATYATADLVLGRDVQHPQATGTAVVPLSSSRFAAITGTGCEGADLPIPPLTTGFTIAGTRLAADFEPIAIPAGEVEVELEVEADSDAYQVTVFEIVANGSTTLLVNTRTILSASPAVTFPADVFVPGRIFGIGVLAITGIPGARDGDFVTRDDAGSTMFFPSTAFTVN